MAIPSTDVALVGDGTTPGLFYEANLSSSPPSSGASLITLSFFSYFAGPSGGGGSIDYNCYGRGEGSGANRILGTNAVGSNNVDMDDFKGITYFYDNSGLRKISSQNLFIFGVQSTKPLKRQCHEIFDFLNECT